MTVTINDNDHVPVELSWEQSSFTVDEDVGTVTLKAEVTTTVDKMPETGFVAAVSVETVDDSATQGADYTRLSTSHSFRQGDFSRIDTGGGLYRYRATREFSVTVRDDTLDEESEEFEVVLAYTNPSLPHLTSSSADAIIAIVDNDHVPVTLGWAETQFTVEEPTSVGDTTQVTLTARAVTSTDKRPESGFSFQYTVNTANGTARQPGDYQQLSVTETFDRFDFSRETADGQSRWVAKEDFTVLINHDTITRETETFRVQLAFDGPSQPHLLRGDMTATATVTVTDDASSLSDLSTSITVDSSSAMRGGQLTYSWSVANSDVTDTTNVKLAATLDSGVTFVSADVATPTTGPCGRASRTVTCTLGTLAQFASASGTIVVNVSDNASADIVLTARAEGDQLDRTPADNEDSVTTGLDAPPQRISNLSATVKGGHIDLTWSKPGDNGSPITSYELERKAGAEDYVTVTPPDPNALSYRDEDVVKGTLYIYQLRSSNFDGDSEWSNEAEGQLRVAPPPPITGGGGGGGGGGGSANRPPKITGPKSLQYPEHSTEPVATYEAEDPEGTEITWQIEDTDEEHFRISEDGVLSFITPPDYEHPVDFRLNNTYEIRLLAFDSGIPSQSGRLQVRIEIRRVNELDPVSGDVQLSTAENQTGVLTQYQVEDPEGDAVAWSLSGPDAALFQIDETGTLSLNSARDFEALGSSAGTNNYSVTIVATDDGRPPVTQQLEVTVTVIDANEEPVGTVGTEIPLTGFTAGNSPTTLDLSEFFADPDGDSLTYTIDGAEDSNVATAVVEESILSITPLEEGTTSLVVTGSDAAGLSVTVTIEVSVAIPPPPEPKPTPAPEPTPTPTPEPTVTQTSTPTPVPAGTPTPTAVPTAVSTPTPMPTPTATPAPLPTSVPTPAPTATPTPTPSPIPSPASLVTPTASPTAAFTSVPSPTPDATKAVEPITLEDTERAGMPAWLVTLIVVGFLLAIVGAAVYAYRHIKQM